MYIIGSGELWGLGTRALKAFSHVATRLGICGNTPKSKVVAEENEVLSGCFVFLCAFVCLLM